eukprot:TRINITY_DN2624_c0_g1_i3.p1 TRINITY_DN2624_c0_g1~~TRINITY_DN2624_c0_g1_i3.p1  ORF type:complete len:273 (+),score=35.59 TRINITY_DN2624_c0_g1_i3:59-877(+)
MESESPDMNFPPSEMIHEHEHEHEHEHDHDDQDHDQDHPHLHPHHAHPMAHMHMHEHPGEGYDHLHHGHPSEGVKSDPHDAGEHMPGMPHDSPLHSHPGLPNFLPLPPQPKPEEPPEITHPAVPYNPFQTHVIDENKLIFQRLYDRKYQDYIKNAEVRTAHQLALAYFRDANPLLGACLHEFRERDVVVLDREDKPQQSNNNTIHLLFVKNCLRHVNVTSEEFEDIQLNQSQLLVLSDDVGLSANSISKINQFVVSGGLVLSFNKAISIVSK